ncbi:hypothetical protein MYSTI_06981 [Myxococcus stipitatus DSM 14675]|uniref:Lipoprotein n=1 Tax=Myxococcus stipitatus (strain DSM 14675 / JCM 12634 / Mx s8) TaxID=1278073 RepID=L7UJS5_MYXSD|nr:hypothetical protein MYSTI_06981 [Myxococcus stipitatus DSM 14675]
MKKSSSLVACLALLAVACGGGAASESPATESQTAELLPSGDPLIGTWCEVGWPGCVTIYAGGSGSLTSGGDGCWYPGDSQYAGLTPTGVPNQYTGTRYMYGTGICAPIAPQSVTITLSSAGDSFTEVTSGGFSATWRR